MFLMLSEKEREREGGEGGGKQSLRELVFNAHSSATVTSRLESGEG